MPPEDSHKDKYEVPPLGRKKNIPLTAIQQVAKRLPELLKGLGLNAWELAMILFLISKEDTTASIADIHQALFFSTKPKSIVDNTLASLEKLWHIELLWTNKEKIYQLQQIKEVKLTQTWKELLLWLK